MKSIDGSQLKKLNRIELLELLVEQGEQLEQAQEQLILVEARAAHQERIARLAEDAAARLSGILEAAQLAQAQYMQNLRELKAQMGVINETVSNEEGSSENGAPASVTADPAAVADTVNAVSAAAFAANAASIASAMGDANAADAATEPSAPEAQAAENADDEIEEVSIVTVDVPENQTPYYPSTAATGYGYGSVAASGATGTYSSGYDATTSYGYANPYAYQTAASTTGSQAYNPYGSGYSYGVAAATRPEYADLTYDLGGEPE